jgi:hypothetical protein
MCFARPVVFSPEMRVCAKIAPPDHAQHGRVVVVFSLVISRRMRKEAIRQVVFAAKRHGALVVV